jgi:type I restriction enzyme S subunit
MSEWKEYQLSQIMELIGGGTPKTTVPEYWGGNIPLLSVTDFNTGKKYCFDAEKKITERGLSESSTKILKKGQIIISARGTVGVLSVLGRDMAFNQSCYGIDAKKSLTNNDFLYYLLKNNIASLHSASYGAVFDTITKETFSQIVVSIPPLPEQHSIASILSSLDDKIDLLHRQNKTLEALAQTLFRQWFVEEAEEGWKEGKLGDVLELLYGKGLKEEIRTGKGFPVIGSNGVVGFHSEFLVEGPGIVIGRKGTLGKVIYLFENFFPIDTTYYIKSKVNSVGLFYEYFLLKTLNFEEMNSDSAVPGLNRDIALSTEIKIAPLDKLNEFNQYCYTLLDKLNANNQQIRTLEKLRDTLLPKLISGEVRVKSGQDGACI